MRIKHLAVTLGAIALLLMASHSPNLKATAQDDDDEPTPEPQFTLDGEWRMFFSPINGEMISRKGNTLGFPDRDMIFESNGESRTGFVSREDVGPHVKPMGVWRYYSHNRFSASFQLWCESAQQPCGAIVMKGRFLDNNRVRGIATAFFDVKDNQRHAGYDTWPNSFTGQRLSGGSD